MPASITINRPMITVRVRWAFFTVGSRNARTPLLTASTPVIAVQPFEKTCSNSQKLAVATMAAGGVGGVTKAAGCPPAKTVFDKPIAIVQSRVPRKRYVGTMKKMPASRTPLRFTTVTISRIERQSPTV